MQQVMSQVRLTYTDLHTGGSSHKEYRVTIVPDQQTKLFHVIAWYGRIGGTLNEARKTSAPVPMEEASDIFNRAVEEKSRKGYVIDATDKTPAPEVLGIGQNAAVSKIREIASARPRTPYPIEDLAQIATQQEAEAMLRMPKYWLQIKCDGRFSQFQKRADGSYAHYNKLGGEVSSIPAEVLGELRKLKAKTFFIVGELIGTRFVAENLLELNGVDYSQRRYAERFEALEELILADSRNVTLVANWITLSEKLSGYRAIRERRGEGIVLKLSSATYCPGRRGPHMKFKFEKSCTCKVVATGAKGHHSATLAVLDAGKWREVARASLIGKDKRIGIGTLVEVEYLYSSEGGRLVQPRITKVRDDIRENACTFDQLIPKGAVA